MQWEWDYREQGALQVAYRAHLRAMTAARQAAERQRSLVRSRDPEERRAADVALRRELARIAEEHQAWLCAHGLSVGVPRP